MYPEFLPITAFFVVFLFPPFLFSAHGADFTKETYYGTLPFATLWFSYANNNWKLFGHRAKMKPLFIRGDFILTGIKWVRRCGCVQFEDSSLGLVLWNLRWWGSLMKNSIKSLIKKFRRKENSPKGMMEGKKGNGVRNRSTIELAGWNQDCW